MFVRALAGYEKVVGSEHPSTLSVVDNLGNLYVDQGKQANAEQMYARGTDPTGGDTCTRPHLEAHCRCEFRKPLPLSEKG